jgi:hypothetical protein
LTDPREGEYRARGHLASLYEERVGEAEAWEGGLEERAFGIAPLLFAPILLLVRKGL